MTKILTLFALVFASVSLNAQCECPALPEDQIDKTVVTVSTVSELQSTLQECNANNGNYTILLEDGTYTLSSNLLYISQNMVNLTIRSASGNRDAVIIEGQGMGGNVTYIFNVAADNFTCADMTIGWIGYHAIQIHAEHDADNCLIQNVRFVNTKEQMLKVSGSVGLTFSDSGVVQCCLFEFPDGIAYQWYTGGIDAHAARNWEVRNNTFKHIRSPESSLAEHAIHFWGASQNTLVENNLIINCDRGIGFGLGNVFHYGGIIRNNFVHTTRDVGIGLERSPDTKVYNNTVITENYFNSIEYRFEETVNVHIANNLTNETIASRNGGTGTIENNFETSDLSIFEDAANQDYHLSGINNQIVDAGIELPEVTMDYDCHPRSTGDVPDIGADEFDSMISGINNLSTSQKLLIYPNPTASLLHFELETPAFAEILTLDGKIIMQEQNVQNSLDVSLLEKGIYILKIIQKESVHVERIVKI